VFARPDYALVLPRRSGRYSVAVPAMMGSIPRPSQPTGLPLAALAAAAAGGAADPFTALVRSRPPIRRRICLMIDASNSMSRPFKTQLPPLRRRVERFVTTVAAAERSCRCE
jgi:hypothetical protein